MLKSNIYAEGGMMQEGGTVDPVSGNEVPIGSMKNEVRDDIDAKLSEGEFVFPADVVRYWGLEKLMMMRDKAKKGLQRMNDIGQMGNAEQVPDAEALHSDEDEMDDDTFSSEIDNIIGEVDAESMGGEREFSAGGFAQPGTDYLAKYNIPRSSVSNPALDVRVYKNAEGRVMYITFFNGKPSTPIPKGFTYVGTGQEMLTTKPQDVKKPETPAETTATGIIETGGGDAGDAAGATSGATGATSTDADGLATSSTVSPTAVAAGLTGVSLAMGIPAAFSTTGMVTGFVTDAINSISHSIAAAANVATTGSPAAVDSHSQASSTAPTATTGPSGTGGAAASAAAAAASAAAAAGHSPEAQGAASQAAASATVAGASPAAAANAGANAASVADQGDVAEGGSMAAESGNSVSSAAPGETGVSAEGEASAGGPGSGGGGDSGAGDGDGGAGAGTGNAMAKGGLVKKRVSKKTEKPKGLAGRR